MKPSEQEEFEFRLRLEKEREAQKSPGLIDSIGSAADNYKKSTAYATSPQGMLETVPDLARKGADKIGDWAVDEMGRSGMNPYVSAGLGTITKMAPDVLMAVNTPTVRQPLPKSLERVSNQVEQLSGTAPGALKAAFEDPSIVGGPGKKAASQIYETAKKSAGGIREDFLKITNKREFVDAIANAAKRGEATPAEALEARKTLGEIRKGIPAAVYHELQKLLDGIAKPIFGNADAAYKRAIYSESLGNAFPQNKYGGASAFKLGIMTLLEKMGPLGRGAGMAMSPFVMGRAAANAGGAVSQIPRMATSSYALDYLARKRKKRN